MSTSQFNSISNDLSDLLNSQNGCEYKDPSDFVKDCTLTQHNHFNVLHVNI